MRSVPRRRCHRPARPSLEDLYGHPCIARSDGSTESSTKPYIRESIVNPDAKMAAGISVDHAEVKDQIDEEEVASLIAYIKALAGAARAPNEAEDKRQRITDARQRLKSQATAATRREELPERRATASSRGC